MAEEEGEEILPEPKPKKRSAPVIRTTAPQNDDPAVIVRRQSDALIARATGTAAPAEAQEYRHMSLLDLARDSLTRSGASVRTLSADEVLQRAAHGTGDFALVVSNAANKITLDAYQAAQSPLYPLFRKRTLKDLDGVTVIGAAPKYIVVGPSMETEAEKLLASIYATTTADVNAWQGKLQLIVESSSPRLSFTVRRMFAR
ncbi:Mu-like prophage major head subunit gpT family protein [Pseudomonas sp. GX19020]|uniref:Mu-like prophage major head subunit gpT family protein n=1 Tax=Pseudomonas sp. GX19020 TaxID=2942277 RepID=UPI0020199B51|nr:Mu-like prophage major head subunit gpT family protein [Pseudomonas sp. GX19020]MCL4065654.1 Mu-like prophage major head subunit gpT family protein [Pseudomonas sp. GX19020]